MAVGNLVKSIQQKMRQDAGINGDAQRIEQMVWLFFLKVYDAQEYEWEIDAMDNGEEYKSIIPEDLRWRNWAPSKDEEGKAKGDVLTGNQLLDFINDTLFPVLQGTDSKDKKYKGIKVTRETERHKAIVQEVFQEVNQYMKNGIMLREVIDIIESVDLMDTEESHAFGDIYESILSDLQSAGNAGEFYTPRAVTDFVIEQLNPQLGEQMGDLACGTGGFIVSTLKHLEKQRETADDEIKFQQSVMGQEWKPFPYLLGVTNVMLHGIKDPKIYHMDSLSHPMSDYMEEGKLKVIAMNPPFGGATDATTSKNFKQEYRSSETADLFMVLIMQRLAENGRAGVVLPDGFLFGTDGPKLAIKKRLLQEFNLHTIVRLPASVFAPYASIATNILFFNNENADDAPEGFATKETWFIRLDMPEGYKHFSKTKRMLPEHFNPVREWWNSRRELDDGAKSRAFTPQELIDLQCNFDQCKYPKDEEVILTPNETMISYLDRSEECFRQIKASFTNILNNLHGKIERTDVPKLFVNPWKELADISATLPDKLKKSILQEAIMGKLGTQDPNDEPASVLLEQIRDEKKKLVKEGLLKKKDLIETPVEDSEIAQKILDGWEYVKLPFVTSLIDGNKREGDFVCLDAKFLRGKSSGEKLPKGKFVKKDDNIILVDGENSGEVFTVPCDGYMGSTFKQLWVSGKMYLPYVLYFIRMNKDILRNSKKGAAIPHLNKELFNNLIIGIPPLAEQHRIVQKIEELYAEIDNMTINNTNINEVKETESKE